jgi:hypothetical protein
LGGAIWLSGEAILDINASDDNVFNGNQPDDLYREPEDG